MKKTNLLSLILAVLMLATMLPMFAITASAAQTATEVATTLTTTPDGKAGYVVEAYSFANGNVDNTGKGLTDGGKITDGYLNVVSDSMNSIYTNASKRLSINGVKGIMIPIDTTANTKDTKLYFRVLMDYKVEHATANTNQYDVQLQSCAQNTIVDGFTTKGYLLSDGEWSQVSECGKSTYFLTIPKGKVGCFYVPMSDFSYKGGAGGGATANNSIPLMDVIDKLPTDYVAKVGFWVGNANGTKIGSVYFVYEDSIPAAADKNAVSQSLNLTSAEVKNGAEATLADNVLTVTNCNAPKLNAIDQNEVLISTGASIANGKATGIRFHIDTTALDNGARVSPRIRFNIGKDWCGSGYETFKREMGTILNKGTADAKIETEKLNSATLGMCQSPDSVLYYYVNGEPVAAKLTSDIILKDDRTGADLFEALPAGYVGDIYIPFASFDIGVQGPYAHKWVNMTDYPDAMAKIEKICISHALTGEPSNQKVVYSDFEIVYENTAIDSVSVTVKNDLSMNLYAKVEEGAQNVKVIFKSNKGARVLDTPKQVGGLYKFSYDGILAQNMTDTFDITLSADLDGKTVTKTIEGYSVRANLEALLDETEDAKLKKLIVDMLLYGDAAQKYANYKTDDLASKNLTAEQLALKSEEVNKDSITAHKGTTGTAATGYAWNDAALLLNTRIAVKLGVTAPTGATVVVSVDGVETVCEIKDGYAIFDNVGAYQLGDKMTITFKKDGAAIGQVYTYSVNDYIKEEIGKSGSSAETQALVKALYNYGISAAAYNDSLS